MVPGVACFPDGQKSALQRLAVFSLFFCIAVTCLPVSPAPAAAETVADRSPDFEGPHPALTSDGLNPGDNDAGSFIPTARMEGFTKNERPPLENKKTTANPKPLTPKLPIWGERVREMGYDLPLPFGMGVNLVWMDQGIDIRDLKIGIGDPNSEPGGLQFTNARARDTAATLRVDMWLFPFVNVYGIFGTIDGEAKLDVNFPGLTIDVPGIGPIPIIDPFNVPLDIDYDGTTFGGGITLAAGYKRLFASVDANYTHSEINVVDGEIDTLTVSPRLGVLVETSALKGSGALWIGAMYMDYDQTVTDSVNLKAVDSRLPDIEIDFEVRIKNKDPWNFIFGGQWEITKQWQIVAEGGVGDRKQVITGIFFRF